jgi:pyrroline-5-carboxylate reductase
VVIEKSGKAPKVALIGAGAMGGALLKGWIEKRAIDAGGSAVFDPQLSAPVEALARAAAIAINSPIEPRFDVAVLAVKPQALAVAEPYAPIAKTALVVSVLAGKSIASISSVLGTMRIIRAMPNLPSMIGAGAAGVYAPPAVSETDRSVAAALMEAAGAAVFVDSEAAIDAVTAISGSGPAYFFLMAEALEEAALCLGLSGEAARTLARQTLIGAGAVLQADARSAAELRRDVTSPGGTTEAALKVLDGDGKAVRMLMKSAAEAAFRRAAELTR